MVYRMVDHMARLPGSDRFRSGGSDGPGVGYDGNLRLKCWIGRYTCHLMGCRMGHWTWCLTGRWRGRRTGCWTG